MKAAGETNWPADVRAIGKALAAGLLADDEPINIPRLILPAMTEMTDAHVRLLDLLVMARPWNVGQTEPRRVEKEPHLANARSEWRLDYIKAAYPQLNPVLSNLIGTLERVGLIERNDRTTAALSKYSEAVKSANARPRGSRIAQSPPASVSASGISGLVPQESWSPTALGRQVLAF
jgi:hypothetical protein